METMDIGKTAEQDNVNIFALFLYKLENFLNARACRKQFGNVFYAEDEPSLFLVASNQSNGNPVSFTRWHDLFSITRWEQRMLARGWSEQDCYIIKLVLSRFGYLFDIDNRQRTNKDYFIFFYVIQLITLKNSPMEDNDKVKNHMLRFLLFELSMEYDAYSRFYIQNDKLLYSSDHTGDIDFLEVIATVYDVLEVEKRKEKTLLLTMKSYHERVVHFLVTPDNEDYRIDFDDYHINFIYPNFFMKMLVNDKRNVFNAIIDAVDVHQSNYNLFVSNMILMNYSFYILKNDPRNILKLKKHINDDALFFKVMSALINRRMCIEKEDFEGLDLGIDLDAIEEEVSSLYNIIYRI
ncbi:hypothetical protein E2R60_25935 [Paenibacillus dendritiformis]|uniref:hypothetical protein n=1 Tax=Paenibacillus dendritiformis TaxID=130049 RepID=UPI00105A2D03|nr:hypothetical protein [Paenibacillus dendritiformis]TDL48834.1 hypothetical protein E2R60_25935 [Paenibacillus dendritiformis]